MTALKQINEIADRLPEVVLKDIQSRTTDWLNGGGGEDDHYIHQQLRFAKYFLGGDLHAKRQQEKTSDPQNNPFI